MTALWTSEETAAATGARLAGGPWQAGGVSIDTRTLAPGDLFVALKDQRDGHDFVADALARGAAAALVSRIPAGLGPDAPLAVVPDVLDALVALGRAARARTGARVIAVTGSAGKTSTKDMLRRVLAGQGRVHAAEKSYNNHWGVPLTLARMPRQSDFAVIEIGMNHPGEIAPLAEMAAPDVAIVTNVAPAHLGAFGNVEGIAREKASIFAALRPGGVAIANADLPTSPILFAAAAAAGARLIRFGTAPEAEYRLLQTGLADDVTTAQATMNGQAVIFRILSAGRHFAVNALAVLAATEALGADPALAVCDLGQWLPAAGRGAREVIVMDIVDDHLRFGLLDDAYNANPASMAAALELLAASRPTDGIGRVAEGRRIAILGDMLELGEAETMLHVAIARDPALAGIDLVHCVGERMRLLYDSLPRRQQGEYHTTAQAMAGRVHALIDAGDIVLVKGSLGSRVSLVVDAIRKLGHPLAQNPQGNE